MKILIIATSHELMGDTGRKTGLWLGELAIAYFIFKEAGAILTLASIRGGAIPLDPRSESILATNSTIRRFQKDPEAISNLSHSLSLEQLRADDFDMIYLTGGHGALWDFPGNETLVQLLEAFDRQHKIIGVVSHGMAAVVAVRNREGGSFVKGRQITGYSNSEEEADGLTKVVPFSLESTLTGLGAIYSKTDNYRPHLAIDGTLVSGQNSASAEAVSRKMVFFLQEFRKSARAEHY